MENLGRYSDVTEFQLEGARRYQSEAGRDELRWAYAASLGRGADFWLREPSKFSEIIGNSLEDGDAHYVSSRVCDTIMNHAAQMPPESTLHRTLYTGQIGVFYYEKLMPYHWDGHEVAYEVNPNDPDHPSRTYGVRAMLVVRITPEDYEEAGRLPSLFGLLMLLFVVPMDEPYVPPMLGAIGFWRYGDTWHDDPANTLSKAEEAEMSESDKDQLRLGLKTYAWHRAMFMALMAFEKQKLTAVSHHAPGRGTRRRAEKEGKVVSDVRVILLRKIEYINKHEGEPTGRHIGVRYWVDPFWRNQWYPSDLAHHPKLVVGHFRGQGEIKFTRKLYVDAR